MKSIFCFFFVVFFGFFDLFYFFVMFSFLLLFFFFDFMGFYFGGVFFCDSISFFVLFLSFFVFCFCFFSSLLEKWSSDFFISYLFYLSFIFFLLFVGFMFFSFLMFYVCFELIFMFMFLFVLGWGVSPERLQASYYMVFYTIVVSFPFLFYIVLFDELIFFCKFLFFFTFESYWWVFLFFVFLVKLPVYGVHLWLPKAHVEAPVSGSMLLAGVLLKLGMYGFYRVSFLCYYLIYGYGYFFSLGLVGGLISCFLCLRQVDMKSFVAYSSICHMGFGLSGFFCFCFYGLEGGIYMLISHGFCSSCLFYILYIFYERFHSRSMFVIKGVGYLVPFMSFFWFFFCSINMGVPPFFSFFSEVFILVGCFFLNSFSFFLVFFLLFFAGLYCIFLYVVSCHGVTFLDGIFYTVSIREFLNLYSHLFPLIFLVLSLDFFFV